MIDTTNLILDAGAVLDALLTPGAAPAGAPGAVIGLPENPAPITGGFYHCDCPCHVPIGSPRAAGQSAGCMHCHVIGSGE